MNKKRQNQIEEIAVAVLHETSFYGILPIDVKKVAERKGLGLIRFDFGEDVSGVFMSDGETATIGYNSKNNLKRQRFTIAHELGHYVLGHQRQGVFVDTPKQYFTILKRDGNSSTGEFLQEREANAFAAALLMPKELLRKAILETDFNYNKDDVVLRLAKLFDVSSQAMAFRLTNLDLHW